MAWTEEQDLLLCREILIICESYKFALKSRERGHCWSEVTNRLNECKQLQFTAKGQSETDMPKLKSISRVEWPRKKEKVGSIQRKVS